ncbi:helix-turn-helix domain-containing protein [Paenibacillus psychroresistens]|uniref:helix-turn-helix domain-containing protein n=1 Tax=Paenibacillus psychroresistens TaxID=1778678 RepID=UPI00139159D2
MELSPKYLARLFKQYTLKSILDCVTNARITKAKELLLQSELSIAEISEQVGLTELHQLIIGRIHK